MKFGQYELLERIAVGGMAEVYRGRVAGAEGFEKLVAIKRVLPEYARDERFISMLLTEARIHSALSHRNIVQIHDLGISEEGEYFIVLEYVEGHDLRAVMEAATALGVQIPDSLALHIAYELAQALHFAHELKDADGHPLGIVHRDVSPSNVLLSNSGEVKLSDFGIAKRQRDHSVVGSLKGNLVYMSPEQARKGPVDRRTDVFSLGAVLFEMLTGHKPREIRNEVDGWREVVSGGVRSARELRGDIPEAYEALLARAMASDPKDRFPDAALFGAAIRELLRESEAPAGPNDIKELIEVLDPPRHARSPVERSKLIRLGPEFKLPAGLAPGTGSSSVPPIITAPPASPALPGSPSAEPAVRPPLSTAGPLASPSPADASSAATPPPPATPGATPPPVGRPARGRTDLGLGKLLRPELLATAQPLSQAKAPSPTSGATAETPPPPATTTAGGPSTTAAVTPPPKAAGAGAGGRSRTPPPFPVGSSGARTPPPVPAISGRTPPPFPVGSSGARTPPPVLQPPSLPVAPPPFPAVALAPPAIVMAPTPSMMPGTVNGSSVHGVNGRGHGPAGLATAPLPDAGMPTPPPEPNPETTRHDAWVLERAASMTPLPSPTPPPSAPMTAYAPPPAVPGRSGGFPGGPQPSAGFPMGQLGQLGGAPFAPFDPVAMQKRSGFPFLRVLLVLILMAGGAAAFVHLQVMPLPVLLVWNKPASVQVSSDPAGADVKLDGKPIGGPTPTKIQVKRDRNSHTLEVSKTGFAPAERTLRFDKNPGELSETLTLTALPPPPPPPEPPKAEEPPPEPPVAAAPEPKPEVAAKPAEEESPKKEKASKAHKKSKKPHKKAKHKK